MTDTDTINTHLFNWEKDCLSYRKYKRRTIEFGEYFNQKWSGGVIHIREQSIMRGGFGCSLWDAAILFSRWLYSNNYLLENKIVLELGSGVGLCGLLAARYARKVYLTDYLEPILENLEYNKAINSSTDDDEYDEEEIKCKENIYHNSEILYLDWDNNGSVNIPKVDIIIGSELTYSDISVKSLVNTITKFLKEDGVFYEILSDDRDGVKNFISEIEKEGFDVIISPIPNDILKVKFNSSQRSETYHFYTFKPKKSNYPILC